MKEYKTIEFKCQAEYLKQYLKSEFQYCLENVHKDTKSK